MDPDEGRLVLARERDAGGAVRLVADHQVEWVDAELLGLGNGCEGLVGREHHGEAGGALAVPHLFDELGRVGGHRDGDVVG